MTAPRVRGVPWAGWRAGGTAGVLLRRPGLREHRGAVLTRAAVGATGRGVPTTVGVLRGGPARRVGAVAPVGTGRLGPVRGDGPVRGPPRSGLLRPPLRGTGLVGTGLVRAGLVGTGLTGAGLVRAGVLRSGPVGAGLRRTGLVRARLRGTRLRGTGLRRTRLRRTRLSGTRLRRAGAGAGRTGRRAGLLRRTALRRTGLRTVVVGALRLERTAVLRCCVRGRGAGGTGARHGRRPLVGGSPIVAVGAPATAGGRTGVGLAAVVGVGVAQPRRVTRAQRVGAVLDGGARGVTVAVAGTGSAGTGLRTGGVVPGPDALAVVLGLLAVVAWRDTVLQGGSEEPLLVVGARIRGRLPPAGGVGGVAAAIPPGAGPAVVGKLGEGHASRLRHRAVTEG
ncbi:pentapeptide repeat-containing protein [Pseudonocardia phyllosphaerae]|uniref:pentapeptide repeat-containing protein n=1 Tax=Pseudonocardia phyllosphaerae TaxID=3390502 RepID=UPI00397BB418